MSTTSILEVSPGALRAADGDPKHAPSRPAAAQAFSADAGELTEVVARFGGHVVDVSHVDPKPVRRRLGKLALGAGLCMMIGGGALFAHEAAQPWEAWQSAAKEAALEAAPAPAKPGWGTGGLGLGLALFGLVPFVYGGMSMSESRRRDYAVGEDPAADIPLGGVDSHSLIEPTAAGPRLHLLPGMRADVYRGDEHEAFAPAANMTLPPLPPGAWAQVEAGPLSFTVRGVSRAAVAANRGEIDRPFWAITAGTAAVAAGLFMLLRMIPSDAMAFEIEEEENRMAFARYLMQPDEIVEEPEEINDDGNDEAMGGSPGQRAHGQEGKAGKPTSKAQNKRMAVKGPAKAIPAIGRTFDPSMKAREAGILGVMAMADAGHFLSDPAGAAFTVGNADEDVWGNMTGTEVGEAYGVGGLGLVGDGKGGGGTAAGVMGLGHTGTIGTRGKNGHGLYGHGTGTGFKKKGKSVPVVRVAKAELVGNLDKDIIRRIVRNHINEVRSCYNTGLSKNPTLQGRVKVQWSIGGTGKVLSSAVAEDGTGDRNVANCIAKAVKRWKFPKPGGGGTVMVTYPFVLRPAS